MKIAFVAGFGPIVRDVGESRRFWGDGLGIELTESFAMTPAAAVSGIYLAHPQARYFAVGRIGRDQLENYAARKGVRLAQAEEWLAPSLF